ncbi:endonuclease/exonuclease/phosphatase family protein [Chryseobacterium sp.]|uniref:endonuclease/exonuclease/phosphatase family protein n=1 Tax=Chryseobacterium sp. TaxID=1871047 RepID=UPI0012A783CA|nr:endonuclease/exonuclease/phosphatase family protein [Chryseobacterium sp.]QFG52776.1 endonuclease/exonuclease/phosphatase family protein [Chryseobacterium sp.]
MELFLNVLSALLILLSVLPFIRNQHWIFRVPEFMKIQLLILQAAVFGFSIVLVSKDIWFWVLNTIQFGLMCYHLYVLIRYTKFYKRKKTSKTSQSSSKVKILSVNVHQFNTEFSRFHELIAKHQPDIFITMETDSKWEEANRKLEKQYPHTQKMTLDNTYGMHLYSKMPLQKSEIHFFVADDIPSFESHFKTEDGRDFILFGVHPPPPSPTEERTSKERDGDLLCVAKKIRGTKTPTLVIGDFNTVAWSDTSILFRKTSELIDARVGRGILATFHAKYWFFRVPLDLLFHSSDIFVDRLETLEHIGSDHFPILCEFHIDPVAKQVQKDEVKTLKEEEKEVVDELIVEGRKEESDNRDRTEHPH